MTAFSSWQIRSSTC